MTVPPSPQRSVSDTGSWWVVCLCAAWCNTCGDYRATFDAASRQWPGMRFEWLDIEDESDIAGELDVETFPTVLIADGAQVLFLGPLVPQESVLNRLIASLTSVDAAPLTRHGDNDLRTADADQAQAVFDNLRKVRG